MDWWEILLSVFGEIIVLALLVAGCYFGYIEWKKDQDLKQAIIDGIYNVTDPDNKGG